MYSIKVKLSPYKNEDNAQRITFQIIVNRIKINLKTSFAVKETQFKKERVIGHPLAEKYNYSIQHQKLDIETKLLEAFRHKPIFSKRELESIIKGKTMNGLKFSDFAEKYKTEMQDKLSAGRLKRYQTLINKVDSYNSLTMLADINGEWLTAFENHLRTKNITNSTILSNIKVVKAIVMAARKRKLIKSVDFFAYTPIKLTRTDPDFLTEAEINDFQEACEKQTTAAGKVPGYLFLLSCYAGLRISDAIRFDRSMVKDGQLVYYAQKNKKRCAIPLYPALQNVVDFLISNPYKYHENTMRVNVRTIMKEAGITRHTVYHISRHTFCTIMLQKRFTIPEVAEMAGDTVKTISETYAHVDKKHLHEKVKMLLG